MQKPDDLVYVKLHAEYAVALRRKVHEPVGKAVFFLPAAGVNPNPLHRVFAERLVGVRRHDGRLYVP